PRPDPPLTPEGTMPSAPSRRLTALALALALAPPAAAQTWDGSTSTDWLTATNWTPASVPNSATAVASFTGAGLGEVKISTSVQAQSLQFSNLTGSYTLTSNAGQTLSSLTVIGIGPTVTGTQTINFTNIATGNLLFASGGLTINNSSTSGNTTLVIGPNTVIGTTGSGGVTVSGSGTTQIGGSFASGSNDVTGGLTKSGPGKLIFSGNGTNLQGGLKVFGGTLELNYA